jgi:hypothetical protein
VEALQSCAQKSMFMKKMRVECGYRILRVGGTKQVLFNESE